MHSKPLSISCLLFLALLSTMVSAEGTSSTLTHTTLVIIVIIELFFAFGVAATCVLFSWNLMRSIRSTANQDSSFQSMPQGDFPRVFSPASSIGEGWGGRRSGSVLSEPLTGTYNTFYRSRGKGPLSNPDLLGLEGSERKGEWDVFSDEDLAQADEEQNPPASSLFQSFFSYVRIM